MNASSKKRPSAPFVVTIVIALIAFAIIAIPNILPHRFDWASAPLAVRVHVTDQRSGDPVGGATLQVSSAFEDATTGPDGRCEAIAHFRETGTLGRSAKLHLWGALKVSAPGYKTWEEPLVSLFGSRYDSFNKGTSVTYAVTLNR
jgi:hypothetical protein